jgi:hypothetical protein
MEENDEMEENEETPGSKEAPARADGDSLPDEDPEHDCQPPRDDAPAVGSEWQCPECGTWWRLEDAQEHPEHLPDQRDQRVNWVREGKREG